MINRYTKIIAVSIFGLTAFQASSLKAEVNVIDPLQYSLVKAKLGVRAGVTYNDNIFRAPSSEESDFIATLSPKVKISSDLDKHYIGVTARAEGGRYFSNTENDYIDADIRADGRIDLNEMNAIYLGAKYMYDHVSIGSFVDDLDSRYKKPATYTKGFVYSRIEGQNKRFHYGAGLDGHTYDYNNVDRIDGTISIQDDRDQYGYNVSAQLGYEVVPTHQIYVLGKYGERIHEEDIDSSVDFTRDSEGRMVAIGISHDEEDTSYSYNAFVGYLEQDYEANQMPDLSDLALYVNAKWDVSGSNQIKVNIDRQVKDSYSTGVSAYLETGVELGLRHKYSKDISFGASARYTKNEFENNSALSSLDRKDDIYGAKIWGQKEISDNLSMKINYEYRDRDSNDSDAIYTAQKVGFSLSYKY